MGYAPLMMAATAQTNPIWNWILENLIIILGLGVVILALGALWNTFESIVDHKKRELLAEQGIEFQAEVYKEEPSFLSTLSQKAWDLIPIDKEEEIDLGHDYDGIRELDNKLPPWWVYTFYLTIAIGIGYLYVYHFSDIGVNQKTEYLTAMEDARIAKVKYLATQANSVDESNVVVLTDEGSLAEAKELFTRNCVSCHGPNGQGLAGLGPNFTDPYWIHGGGVKNIFKTIKYGVPEKGMISWQTQLQPASMQKLASYIISLEGTNPPNPKEPQGEIWVEENVVTEVKE